MYGASLNTWLAIYNTLLAITGWIVYTLGEKCKEKEDIIDALTSDVDYLRAEIKELKGEVK